MAETRQRITEAAVELHGSIGPARTTVAAIAERAGVQRHTVYRHFPTEADIFAACADYFEKQYPWPDPATWDGDVSAALTALYVFYADTEHLNVNVFRDADVKPLAAKAIQPFLDYLTEVTEILAGGSSALRKAAIRHAIDFQTWRSLVRHLGLEVEDAVTLMTGMIDHA